MAKILVADDNSNIQKMVGLALKDQGIDVVAVGNGEAAVRKISDVKPDLVLADVFMPVRNGYEVCRYVKEDSSLSHIPVILLVGAFDPLDEQEAQRVGADGVLKKPFVPPDPLISMVKSALTRAGVAIGNEAAEKVPEAAGTPAAKDLLTSGVSSKVAALSGSALPEAEAEPFEEFPAPPPSVKIAAGSEPVAFGSLLETPEDDMAFTSKPIEELEQARNWDAGGTDEAEEEEAEEKESRGGWRPGTLDEADEPAVPSGGSKVKDWRQEAFQGHSPASISSGRGWSPVRTTQVTQEAEVAGAPASVGVSTMESKPSEAPAPSPFAGDAWAAALANTVEHKIVDVTETPATENEAAEAAAPEPVAAPAAAVEQAQAAKTVMAPSAPVTETPSWADPSTSAWELEAKKASLLAATWDAPAPAPVPVESASVAEAEKYLAEEAASEAVSQFVEQAAARVEEMRQAPAAPGSSEAAPETAEEPMQVLTEEHVAQETSVESAYASGAPLDVNATQEVPVLEQEESHYSRAFRAEEPVEKTEAAIENAAPAAMETEAAPPATQQPDMDALVARVLAKMNPEVLQKVTREILKPVIEAIIKDELNQKK